MDEQKLRELADKLAQRCWIHAELDSFLHGEDRGEAKERSLEMLSDVILSALREVAEQARSEAENVAAQYKRRAEVAEEGVEQARREEAAEWERVLREIWGGGTRWVDEILRRRGVKS